MKRHLFTLFFTTACLCAAAQEVPKAVMEHIYQEVKTPFKYGLVVAPADNYHKFDCPTVFRCGAKWFMTYVCYDGKGSAHHPHPRNVARTADGWQRD